MMNRSFEAALGLAVVIVFGFFAWTLVSARQADQSATSEYIAIFRKVDGLRAGDDVRIGGVKVGTITDVEVDPKSYEVLATISIGSEFTITQNASASVLADGLLGGAFVALNAGFGAPLGDGGFIENTNDAVNLTELLSQMIFNSSGE